MVDYFRRVGCNVYQEVQVRAYDKIADIVTVNPECGSVFVIETKLHLGLDVIAQADGWFGHAHQVYCAVPKSQSTFAPGRVLGQAVLTWRGIGLIEVARGGRLSFAVSAKTTHEPKDIGLLTELTPEQENYAPAGNAEGRRLTPFVRTCNALRELITGEPGLTVKAAMAKIPHHYRTPESATCAIKKYAAKGHIPGITARFDGRRFRLYPAVEGDWSA